jgi:Mycothiol maleylpyruvate isomerase N-terminal domain
MTTITTDVTTIGPLTHAEAMRRQEQELRLTLTMLRSLDDGSWSARTDCPAWDVRGMYQHVLGGCEAGASMRENIRQLRQARAHRKRHGGPLEAALSAVQVRERAGLSPAQVTDRLAAVAPRTVRGRSRTPAHVRERARPRRRRATVAGRRRVLPHAGRPGSRRRPAHHDRSLLKPPSFRRSCAGQMPGSSIWSGI